MNKQFKLSLLAASLVTAFAANVAYAGNIQSSSVQIAREVITNDLQAVDAPLITYAFQGDIDATLQDQTFQIQLTLTGGGEWSAATASSVSLVGGPSSGTGAAQLDVTPLISADKKTLYATITVAKGVDKVYRTPSIKFNNAAKSKLAKLKSVVGDVASCDNTVKTLPVSIQHFTGISQGGLATAANATPDEHVRNGQNSTGMLLTFPTNIAVKVTAANGDASIDATVAGQKLKGTTASSWINSTLANLGTVALEQQNQGYDSDLANKYALAPGLSGVATAVATNGVVEVKSVTVDVTAASGFAAGSSVFLGTSATCSAAIPGTTVLAAAYVGNTAKITVTSANLAAAFAGGTGAANVCYSVPGNTAIPSSAFSANVTVVKADGAGDYKNEQNNSCSGSLYSLAGAVKIDVRNYSTSATTAGNWMSVIRIINPSETNTATVYGQLIHADGSYGNWGPLGTLKPRAVVNMASDAINALLVNTPATPAAGANYTVGAAKPVVNAGGQPGDRLRISAEGVGALRVQNYLYNPNNQTFVEGSASQGVDFDGPDGISDRANGAAQLNSQDAQFGIRK